MSQIEEKIEQIETKISMLQQEVINLQTMAEDEEDEFVIQKLDELPKNEHSIDLDEQVAIVYDKPSGYLGSAYDDGVLRAYADPSDDDDGLEWEYDANDNFVKLNHKDTSSVSDTSNSNGYVVQNLTFDTFGHVLTITAVDLDDRYVQTGSSALLPSGGLKYQQLTKDSNADFDVSWDWTRAHS